MEACIWLGYINFKSISILVPFEFKQFMQQFNDTMDGSLLSTNYVQIVYTTHIVYG